VKAINLLAPAHEHEFEASEGLPEALPRGERLLWQARPSALALARQALWADWVAAYFALLAAWELASGLADGQSWATAGAQAAALLLPAALALGLLGLIAQLMARTTVYTLTNRRLVMRIGVVLSITFNLPLQRLAAVDLRRRANGSGDLVLSLKPGDRIAYPHLWPHARPWRLKHPQPMLRALPDVDARAAELLAALRQEQAR
jgi:Bacterial PH domain